ncbi:uncharacterized protein FPRO_09693 [Fusarium proliferatum ET1]|uniref:Uncharacterized protein n=1 Tax=Fusarium proliferatum (strain ET1) TaxID=1227346 RepID=A0A1L7VPK4_FUSPR|nr:uncharacterized protein FPRO_09693 [Fusarium proliferatum ET1]CZR42391.1 uncharacterized protein FPRO_09693 [Fusarium proliferatum ET1]
MVCITKCHADTVPFLGSFLFQLSLVYGGGGAVQNLSTYLWPDRIQWLPLAVALLVIGKVSSKHLEHKVR